MKHLKVVLCVVALVVSAVNASAAGLAIPHTFTANTPAVAQEVNANFSALTTFVNTATTSRVVTATDPTGVGGASCATDEAVVGGGCWCTGTNTAGQNFGVTFACIPAGNGYLGGCFADVTYNPALLSSPIQVTAICVKSQTAAATAAANAAALAKGIVPLNKTQNAPQSDPEFDAGLQRLRQIKASSGR